MRRILVTGGAGFIGSNFVKWLLRNEGDAEIVVLDALTYAGNRDNLEGVVGSIEFVRGDICDRALVERLLHRARIDTIVHFAAETHVDRSLDNPEAFVRTNVMGTFALLEAALASWKSAPPADKAFRFHHISTDEVYGSLEERETPWTEDARYDPHSPYAASKASSDHLVRAYGRTYGLPFTITNCSNNYGPFQYPEKLVPLVITSALEGQPLPVYGDGRQVRDWLYVEDHCQAIWTVIEKGRDGETYNVGGTEGPGTPGGEISNLELVEKICEILDQTSRPTSSAPHRRLIKFVKDRPGHDRRYAVDSQKIRRELGWRPRHGLEEGLRRTIDWYLGNWAWFESIRKRGGYRDWITENYGRRAGRKGA